MMMSFNDGFMLGLGIMASAACVLLVIASVASIVFAVLGWKGKL